RENYAARDDWQSRTRRNGQREPHRRCLLQKPPPSRNRARETQEDPRSNRDRPILRNGRHSLRRQKGRTRRHLTQKLKPSSPSAQERADYENRSSARNHSILLRNRLSDVEFESSLTPRA